MSVGFHQFAWYKDPIVHGYILDSGTPLAPYDNFDVTPSNFTFISKQLGCGGLNATAEFNCMKSVSGLDIQRYLQKYYESSSFPYLNGFVPVVDNITKFKNYTERALAGKMSNLVSKVIRREN